MRAYRMFIFALPVFFLMISGVPAVHAEGEPKQAIETFIGDIKAMEFPAKDTAKQEKLIKEADSLLDLETMGKKALGPHWQEMTAEDQKAFIDLFWKLIENVAYSRSHKFMGDFTITYPEIKPSGNGFEVHSLIKQQEEALNAKVVYHVRPEGSSWKVDDVVLDDVSIVEDLKYQFDRIIAQSKFQGLLNKMKERLAQAEKENSGGN